MGKIVIRFTKFIKQSRHAGTDTLYFIGSLVGLAIDEKNNEVQGMRFD